MNYNQCDFLLCFHFAFMYPRFIGTEIDSTGNIWGERVNIAFWGFGGGAVKWIRKKQTETVKSKYMHKHGAAITYHKKLYSALFVLLVVVWA